MTRVRVCLPARYARVSEEPHVRTSPNFLRIRGYLWRLWPWLSRPLAAFGHGFYFRLMVADIVVKFELFELYYWLELYELYYK